MSGGSYDYKYITFDAYYVGKMYDKELDDMFKDITDLLHDVEWWQSDDIDEEDYRESVNKFKKKWLRQYNKDLCYNYCPHKLLTKTIKEKLKDIEKLDLN